MIYISGLNYISKNLLVQIQVLPDILIDRLWKSWTRLVKLC